jgi:hypothetical protein
MCNVWNIHVPDGLLWQQPNNTFLSTITYNSSAIQFTCREQGRTHCITTLVLHTMLQVWIQIEPQESHQVLHCLVLSV